VYQVASVDLIDWLWDDLTRAISVEEVSTFSVSPASGSSSESKITNSLQGEARDLQFFSAALRSSPLKLCCLSAKSSSRLLGYTHAITSYRRHNFDLHPSSNAAVISN